MDLFFRSDKNIRLVSLVSNLISRKPESPRLRAVISLLLRTQILAVALPGKVVLLKPK